MSLFDTAADWWYANVNTPGGAAGGVAAGGGERRASCGGSVMTRMSSSLMTLAAPPAPAPAAALTLREGSDGETNKDEAEEEASVGAPSAAPASTRHVSFTSSSIEE